MMLNVQSRAPGPRLYPTASDFPTYALGNDEKGGRVRSSNNNINVNIIIKTAFLGKKHCPKWSKISFNKKCKKIVFNKIERRYYSTKNNNIINSHVLSCFINEKKLNPVYIYEDLHVEENRKVIQKECKGYCGVYLILNKITKDFYIGSASTSKIYMRFSCHLLYKTGNKIVKRAVNKYGLENFAFLILELFSEKAAAIEINNKNLLNRENFYLKSLLPKYNILLEAGNTLGYKHTEITRIKMRTIYSQERRDRIGALNRGKKLRPETIAKIRQSSLTSLLPAKRARTWTRPAARAGD